jgi:hypothetical protein
MRRNTADRHGDRLKPAIEAEAVETARPSATGPAVGPPSLPADVVAELRRALAQALVADYLEQNKRDKVNYGACSLADANPTVGGRG